MRPEGLGRVRGVLDGEEIDLDRALQEAVDARAGHPRQGRVHVRSARLRRDVAVGFLVDLSSSTNESADGSGRRIIDVEKAALVVAAEAMHALGDPFAIWGFSGYGRAHVSFLEAKSFSDPWDDSAARRVGRMSFKMENRDGAAVRHATTKLLAQPAHARLLVLLSDGKPLDCGCDRYHDRYAQEDTRMALREARRAGVRVYCVTVDPTGPRYLPRMYGDVAWTVIDRVDQLPERLARALQRLVS
jgi:nitric oxide reductase activation protein